MSLIGGSLIAYGSVGIFNMLRSVVAFQGKDILVKDYIFNQKNKTFPKLNINKHNDVHGFELIQFDKKIKMPTTVGNQYVHTPVSDAKIYEEERFLASKFKCIALQNNNTPYYMYYDNFVMLSMTQPNFTKYDMKITNMNYNEVKDKLNSKLTGFYNDAEKNNLFNVFPRIDMNMIVKEYKNNGFAPVYFATYNSLKHFGSEKRVYSDHLGDIIFNYTMSNRLPFTYTSLVIGFMISRNINVFKIYMDLMRSFVGLFF